MVLDEATALIDGAEAAEMVVWMFDCGDGAAVTAACPPAPSNTAAARVAPRNFCFAIFMICFLIQ